MPGDIYNVVSSAGVAWHRTPQFDDTLNAKGPVCGATLQGQVVRGNPPRLYLEVTVKSGQKFYLPLHGADGSELLRKVCAIPPVQPHCA